MFKITKKRLITALIFAIASISVAAEEGYSLDKIRAIFIEQSYSKKIWDIELKKSEAELSEEIRSQQEKMEFSLRNENSFLQEYRYIYEDDFKGSLYGSLSYRDFYIESVFDKSNITGYYYEDNSLKKHSDFYELDKLNIGVKKVVNDLFYSEKKYKKNYLKLMKNQNLKKIDKSKNDELEKIVDEYVEIKNSEGELEVRETQKKENQKQLQNSKEKLQMGEATELEVEFFEIEERKIEEDIKYISETIRNKKRNLLEKIGVYGVENPEFEDISETKREVVERREELELNQITQEIEQENLKFIKRKNQPEFVAGINYESVEGETKFIFEIKGDYFSARGEEYSKKLELDKLKLQYKQSEELIKQETDAIETERVHLENMIEIYSSLVEANSKKFEFSKKTFFKGYSDYSEYLETLKELKQSEIDLLKFKNQLAALYYKMRVRSGS